MGSQAYQITFAGRGGSTVRSAFDDCEVVPGERTTTILTGAIDQAALLGLIQRGADLGLELLDLRLAAAGVASRPAGHPGTPP